MTLYEYNIRMTAYKLAWLDQEKMIHELAWANQQVQATKNIGKKTVPVYDTFDKFFNYKKHEKEILGISDLPKDKKLQSLLAKANT